MNMHDNALCKRYNYDVCMMTALSKHSDLCMYTFAFAFMHQSILDSAPIRLYLLMYFLLMCVALYWLNMAVACLFCVHACMHVHVDW